MFFFGLPAILMAVYGWNFRIFQTINEYQKRKARTKFLYNWMSNAAGAFVTLVRLCFSSPCITPVSLSLYVRCKCLASSELVAALFSGHDNSNTAHFSKH